MSSRVFQSIVLQMKECTDRVIGVVDDQGTVHILFTNFINPLNEFWFKDSLIKILSDKLSFFPITINTIDIIVINPIPPICISANKIICPIAVNCSTGITVVRPVTQTAEVDTKSESIIFIGCLLHIGKLNSNAPISIMAIIASNNVLVGSISLFTFSIVFIPLFIYIIFFLVCTLFKKFTHMLIYFFFLIWLFFLHIILCNIFKN